ncbi:hypothetical protein ACX801_07820 [Arthrobacter bambusae]
MRKTLLAFITAIALMFAAPLAATAATGTSNSKDYSALAAKWWSWVLPQPTSTNPLLDRTGAQCANQQSGNVWFLVGLFNTSDSVTRTCTIPAHTAVFFPLANAFDCELPGTPTDTVSYVRSQTAFVRDGASNLYVNLDGQAVSPSPIEFEHSDLFSVTLPTDNLFGASNAGFYNLCADSGYYALLKNLSPGSHVLQFSGTLGGQTITATYYLTIAS